MKFTRDEYISRINNASPLQLIVITYELALVNLEDALHATEKENFEASVKKAQGFLMQLMASLDMGYPIANNLLNIYLYVNKQLHEAYFSFQKTKIEESIEVLNSLLESFEILAIQEEKDQFQQRYSDQGFSSLQYKNGAVYEHVFENSKACYKA